MAISTLPFLRGEYLRRGHDVIDLPQQPEEHLLDGALARDLLPQPREQLVDRRRLAPERTVYVAQRVRDADQVGGVPRIVDEARRERQHRVEGFLVAIRQRDRESASFAQFLDYGDHLGMWPTKNQTSDDGG